MLKSGWAAHRTLVSPPVPMVLIGSFELIGTWLGLGLEDFGTKGLGPELDNITIDINAI